MCCNFTSSFRTGVSNWIKCNTNYKSMENIVPGRRRCRRHRRRCRSYQCCVVYVLVLHIYAHWALTCEIDRSIDNYKPKNSNNTVFFGLYWRQQQQNREWCSGNTNGLDVWGRSESMEMFVWASMRGRGLDKAFHLTDIVNVTSGGTMNENPMKYIYIMRRDEARRSRNI